MFTCTILAEQNSLICIHRNVMITNAGFEFVQTAVDDTSIKIEQGPGPSLACPGSSYSPRMMVSKSLSKCRFTVARDK